MFHQKKALALVHKPFQLIKVRIKTQHNNTAEKVDEMNWK